MNWNVWIFLIVVSLVQAACSMKVQLFNKESTVSGDISLFKGTFPLGEPTFTGRQKFNMRSAPGNRFVFSDQQQYIHVLNSEGKLLKRFKLNVSNVTGVAPDNAGTYLYISGVYTINGTSFVEKYDYNGNLQSVVMTFAPIAGATDPINKLKMAPDNTLYMIHDNRIQKYDLGGTLLDSIGTGINSSADGEFRGVQDFVFLSGGYIKVVDQETDRMQTFDANGDHIGMGGTITWPKPTTINMVDDFQIDSDGNYFATSKSPNAVIKFNAASTLLFSVDGTENGNPAFASTVGVSLFNNHIYVSSGISIYIYKNDGTVEAFYDRPLVHPTAVTQRADGTTFVADDNGIHKYIPDGQLVQSFGTGSAQMGLAVDSNNILYATSVTQAGILKRYDGNDGALSDISLPSSVGIYGICTDPSNNVFVADIGGIFKISAGTTTASTFVAGMYTGVACGKDGSVYGLLYDSGNAISSIVKYDSTGGVVTTFPNAGAGNYGLAMAIAVDKVGRVFVQDGNLTNQIIVFDKDQTVLSPIAPTGINAFNGNRGMFVDAAGNVLVADADNHYVKKFSPSGVQLFE